MDTALIINPLAGGVNKRVILKVTKRFGNNVKVYYTSFEDGKFDIPGFDPSNFKTTVAMGGDGTANDIVNLILKQGNERVERIGLIPRGTGNGYLKALESPKSLTKSIETILDGETRQVDVIHMTQPIDIYALNFLDIGAIARILERRNQVNEWTKKNLKINSTGIVGYTIAITKAVRNLPKLYVEEGFVERKKVISRPQIYEDIVIGIGYTPNHFPAMAVLPKGELNNGLRVAFYEKANVKAVWRMLSHGKVEREEYSGKSVTLIINGEPQIQVDGNLIPYTKKRVTNVHVKSESGKMEVIVGK